VAEDPERYEDMFADVAPVRARRMFGGLGLKLEGISIGIVVEGVLYLKVDAATKPRFEAAGGKPFLYAGAKGQVAMPYWTPPPDIFDDPDQLRIWTLLAFEAATRSKAAAVRTPRKAKTKPRLKTIKGP
jgi:DNA transformation protein and related proteins